MFKSNYFANLFSVFQTTVLEAKEILSRCPPYTTYTNLPEQQRHSHTKIRRRRSIFLNIFHTTFSGIPDSRFQRTGFFFQTSETFLGTDFVANKCGDRNRDVFRHFTSLQAHPTVAEIWSFDIVLTLWDEMFEWSFWTAVVWNGVPWKQMTYLRRSLPGWQYGRLPADQ